MSKRRRGFVGPGNNPPTGPSSWLIKSRRLTGLTLVSFLTTACATGSAVEKRFEGKDLTAETRPDLSFDGHKILKDLSLSGSKLTGRDLSGACIEGVDFRGVDLTGMKFSRAIYNGKTSFVGAYFHYKKGGKNYKITIVDDGERQTVDDENREVQISQSKFLQLFFTNVASHSSSAGKKSEICSNHGAPKPFEHSISVMAQNFPEEIPPGDLSFDWVGVDEPAPRPFESEINAGKGQP